MLQNMVVNILQRARMMFSPGKNSFTAMKLGDGTRGYHALFHLCLQKKKKNGNYHQQTSKT